MRGELEATPGVETVRFEPERDEYVVQYRGADDDALSLMRRRVGRVVVLRWGRRLLEEVKHRLRGAAAPTSRGGGV